MSTKLTVKQAVVQAYETTNFINNKANGKIRTDKEGLKVRGGTSQFVKKSRYEVISDVNQRLGWKRSVGEVVEFLLSLFGYKTSKEDKIIKAMREYKIDTLNELFSCYDTYSKKTATHFEEQNIGTANTSRMTIYDNDMINSLHHNFPQFTSREIYLLISQRNACEIILKNNGIIYDETNRRVDTRTSKQCSEVWKQIKTEIHSHETEADTELVKQALLASKPFDAESDVSFLNAMKEFCETGKIAGPTMTLMKMRLQPAMYIMFDESDHKAKLENKIAELEEKLLEAKKQKNNKLEAVIEKQLQNARTELKNFEQEFELSDAKLEKTLQKREIREAVRSSYQGKIEEELKKLRKNGVKKGNGDPLAADYSFLLSSLIR